MLPNPGKIGSSVRKITLLPSFFYWLGMTKQTNQPCGSLVWPFLRILKQRSACCSDGNQGAHFLQGPRFDLADPLG